MIPNSSQQFGGGGRRPHVSLMAAGTPRAVTTSGTPEHVQPHPVRAATRKRMEENTLLLCVLNRLKHTTVRNASLTLDSP